MTALVSLTAFGQDAGAGPGSSRPPQPVITSVAADFKDNTMIISGQYFGNAAPVVQLIN